MAEDDFGSAVTFAPSRIGFGCGNVGGLMIEASEAERRRAVECAVEAGITYFDTAAFYGSGVSEQNLGRSLGSLRAKVAVGTKVFVNAQSGDDIGTSIERSVEQSLQRLGMDGVDLLQLHNSIDAQPGPVSISPERFIDSVLPAFERLRSDGKTRFIGISGHGSTADLLYVIGHGGIDSVQVVYNLLNPSAGQVVPAGYPAQDYGCMLRPMRENGMTALGIRILAGGALSGSNVRHAVGAQVVDPLGSGPSYAADVEQAQRFLPLIEGGEASSLTELATRYAFGNANVGSLVIGFSSLEQMNEVMAWAAAGSLSPSALATIDEIRGGFSTEAVGQTR